MGKEKMRLGLLLAGFMLLPALSCDKPTEPKEEIKAPEERVFRVTILSQSSNPVTGASVVIPLQNTRYALTTNSSGQCALHHLGNDLYGGPENSQLQIPTEGTSITRSFYLGSIPSRMPMLTLHARGVQHPTEILIHGVFLASLGESASTGDLSVYTFRLPGAPLSHLKPGSNTISIRTASTGLTNDPWDDIEFCGLALYD